MVGKFARRRGLFAHHGRRTEVVSRFDPGRLAHVAVLARLATLIRLAVLELSERFFESEAVEQVHVVARPAEVRFFQRVELDDFGVDRTPDFAPLGYHLVFVRFREDALEDGIAFRPIIGLKDVALGDRRPPADFAVVGFHPMANDAGDAFAGGGMAIHVTDEHGLFQLHAHLCMATDAKVTVGASRSIVDGGLHGVEHRAQLGVSVLGNRPLAKLRGMAGGACGGRREFSFDQQLGVVGGSVRQ